MADRPVPRNNIRPVDAPSNTDFEDVPVRRVYVRFRRTDGRPVAVVRELVDGRVVVAPDFAWEPYPFYGPEAVLGDPAASNRT